MNGTKIGTTSQVASGITTTFTTSSDLSNYTNYKFYAIAKDPDGETTPGDEVSIKTYCPGSVTCSNGAFCNNQGTEQVDCPDCNGTGDNINNKNWGCGEPLEFGPIHDEVPEERCPSCDNFRLRTVSGYRCPGSKISRHGISDITAGCKYNKVNWECIMCNYHCTTLTSDTHKCQKCSGKGTITESTSCSHGEYSEHYYCNTHGNVSAKTHTVNCSHGYASQHD